MVVDHEWEADHVLFELDCKMVVDAMHKHALGRRVYVQLN